MTANIPPQLQEFVQKVIDDGVFNDESEVVCEALQLLEQREELRRDVAAGIRELDEGKGIPADEVFTRLQRRSDSLDGGESE